jgi:hypothetical protein
MNRGIQERGYLQSAFVISRIEVKSICFYQARHPYTVPILQLRRESSKLEYKTKPDYAKTVMPPKGIPISTRPKSSSLKTAPNQPMDPPRCLTSPSSNTHARRLPSSLPFQPPLRDGISYETTPNDGNSPYPPSLPHTSCQSYHFSKAKKNPSGEVR